jgi:hypothetical protein
MPRRRLTIVAVAAAATLLLASCVDPPTSVLLEIKAAPGLPSVEELQLTVFNETTAAVKARRLPEKGAPELPDTVVLYPAVGGKLRVQVLGLADARVVGEGTTKVTAEERTQVSASVTLHAGRRPDKDGDGVPDAIDNCPGVPNPDQGPCAGDAGPADAGADGDLPVATDLPLADGDGPTPDLFSPDIDCDKDNDGYTSSACGGTDCDDSSDKAYPGNTEGPYGDATCSDKLDNDCDGSQDLQDTDCNPCTSDTDCDDGSICTTDSCSTSGVCSYTAANEGKACTENKCVSGGKCTSGKCVGKPKTCPPPTNPCKAAACAPTTGCYNKDLPDGTSCNDNDPCTTKEACTSGSCVEPGATPSCYIDSKCYADGYKQDTCHSCDVSSSKTSWTLASGYCYISGTCRADGYKVDSCRACDVSQSTTAWSILSNYCYINSTCRASGYKLDSCRVCNPSKSTTSWSVASGTCYISGTCYQSGATGSGCNACLPWRTQTSWSIKPDCGVVLVALNSGYKGNLGGLSGANSKCAAQATAVGYKGTYKALLSTTSQNAKGVLPSAYQSQPVYNSKGQKLYNSWTAMFTPSKWSYTIYAFNGKKVDEGQASPDWSDADAWHGSTTTGTVRTGYTCGDWTLTTGNGSAGEVDMNTYLTTIESRACSLYLAVLCVRIPS